MIRGVGRSLLFTTAILLPLVTYPASAQDPTDTPSIAWWATGDSYSAGAGLFDTEGDCQRSQSAYAPAARDLLQAEGWTTEGWAFTPCLGYLVGNAYNAISWDVNDVSKGDESKGSLWEQTGFDLTTPLDVITLSFGGNDIGFADVVKDCLGLDGPSTEWGAWLKTGYGANEFSVGFDRCDISREELIQRVEDMTVSDPDDEWRFHIAPAGFAGNDEGVYGSLADFYTYVYERHLAATDGHLVVMGYPRLFADPADWPDNVDRCNGVHPDDARLLNDLALKLHTTVRRQVGEADADRGRIHYIPAFSRYDGRELCGTEEPWLNGLREVFFNCGPAEVCWRKERAFHPNEAGHEAEAGWVADLLRQLSNAGAFGSSEHTTKGCIENRLVVARTDDILVGDGCQLVPLEPRANGVIAVDDLQGGIVYQNNLPAGIISWAPAGSDGHYILHKWGNETGYDAKSWELHDVALLGGVPHAVYTIRVKGENYEQNYEDVATYLVAHPLRGDGTESPKVLGTVAGFESGVTRVDYGGGLFAVGGAGEGFLWFSFYDATGRSAAVPNNPGDEPCEDIGSPPCPAQPVISSDGSSLAFVESDYAAERHIVKVVSMSENRTLFEDSFVGEFVHRVDFDGELLAITLGGSAGTGREPIDAWIIEIESGTRHEFEGIRGTVSLRKDNIAEAGAPVSGTQESASDIVLRGDGVAVATFGESSTSVRRAVDDALGGSDPVVTNHPDCEGAVSVTWRDEGLSIWFHEDRFFAWSVPSSAGARPIALSTSAGLRIGSTVEDVRRLYGDAVIWGAEAGPDFEVTSGPDATVGGWVLDNEVTLLQAVHWADYVPICFTP